MMQMRKISMFSTLVGLAVMMSACIQPPGQAQLAKAGGADTHKVIKVLSGDTLEIVFRGAYTPVKLAGITATGDAAKKALQDLIGTNEVTLKNPFDGVEQRTDDGKLLAQVYVGGKHINKAMIASGAAKFDPKYEGQYKDELSK